MLIGVKKFTKNLNANKNEDIIVQIYSKLQELVLCPILLEDIKDPIILPSGITIDETAFDKLKGK